jgi:DNA-binding transcriptional ArsR family regulator
MDVFDVIADPSRRRLIELLAEGEQQVSSLVPHFDISFSAISQHLRVLSEAKLVKVRRVGRMQVYSYCPQPMDPVALWVTRHAEQFWRRKTTKLGGVLKRIAARGDHK